MLPAPRSPYPLPHAQVWYLTHDPAIPYMDHVAEIRENDNARTVRLADLRHNSDIARPDQVDQKALDRVAKYAQAIRLLVE